MLEGSSRDGLGLELVSGSPWENWTQGQQWADWDHGVQAGSLLKAQNTVQCGGRGMRVCGWGREKAAGRWLRNPNAVLWLHPSA